MSPALTQDKELSSEHAAGMTVAYSEAEFHESCSGKARTLQEEAGCGLVAPAPGLALAPAPDLAARAAARRPSLASAACISAATFSCVACPSHHRLGKTVADTPERVTARQGTAASALHILELLQADQDVPTTDDNAYRHV